MFSFQPKRICVQIYVASHLLALVAKVSLASAVPKKQDLAEPPPAGAARDTSPPPPVPQYKTPSNRGKIVGRHGKSRKRKCNPC